MRTIHKTVFNMLNMASSSANTVSFIFSFLQYRVECPLSLQYLQNGVDLKRSQLT